MIVLRTRNQIRMIQFRFVCEKVREGVKGGGKEARERSEGWERL